MRNCLSLYKTILCCLLLIISISCKKDWLDEKPNKNLSTLETLNDYEALLEGPTMYASALTFGDVASDHHKPTEDLFQFISDYKYNAFTWTQEKPNVDNPFWDNSYTVILYANLALEGLEKMSSKVGQTDIQQFNRIKGGALFQRARSFFELSQIWSPAYDSVTAATDLGIPLRLESDMNLPTRRSTVKETYDQVLNDLNHAKDLLPSLPAYKNRASKAAVFAQLARVYLTIENYDLARINADSCLSIYNTLMDYNSLSTTSEFIGPFNDEVIFHASQADASSFPSSDVFDQDFLAQYDTNDLRRSILFLNNPDGTIVFKGNYYNNTIELFTGLATDEMFLIRAECFARANEIEKAMADVNTLLKKRWNNQVSYEDKTASDSDEALRLVLNEREKELVLRGIRWSDLRRLNKDNRFKKTITHTANGNTWTLEPNSYKYTFPIPDDVIQFSGIPQNSGWTK